MDEQKIRLFIFGEKMTDRVLATVLLLRSLNDVLFAPANWTSQLRRQSVSGEGPSERIECASCNGDGLIRRRGIEVPCEAEGCNGRGWLFVDSYTRRPIGAAETGVIRQVRAVRCDACGGAGAFGNERRCERCGGSGWLEVSVSGLRAARSSPVVSGLEMVPDLVAAAVDAGFPGAGGAYRRRVVAGSYEELSRALEELRRERLFGYRLVVGTYCEGYQEPEDLGVATRSLLDAGLEFVVVRMPEPVRVPGWAARNERRRRERLKRVAA